MWAGWCTCTSFVLLACKPGVVVLNLGGIFFISTSAIFSSHVESAGRAIALPPASALELALVSASASALTNMLKFYVKVF